MGVAKEERRHRRQNCFLRCLSSCLKIKSYIYRIKLECYNTKIFMYTLVIKKSLYSFTFSVSEYTYTL